MSLIRMRRVTSQNKGIFMNQLLPNDKNEDDKLLKNHYLPKKVMNLNFHKKQALTQKSDRVRRNNQSKTVTLVSYQNESLITDNFLKEAQDKNINLKKWGNRHRRVTQLPKIYKNSQLNSFEKDSTIPKYELPNPPMHDVTVVGENFNPYYYPYLVTELPSKVKIQTISKETTEHEPTMKPSSGTYFVSCADAGGLNEDEKSLFGQDRNPHYRKKSRQLPNGKELMQKTLSNIKNKLMLGDNAQLRRLQSDQPIQGIGLEGWDWAGKEEEVVSIKTKAPIVPKKKPRKKKPKQKVNKKNKNKNKKKKEEFRENRLPYHPFTCKPKYMIVSPTKPFSKKLSQTYLTLFSIVMPVLVPDWSEKPQNLSQFQRLYFLLAELYQ